MQETPKDALTARKAGLDFRALAILAVVAVCVLAIDQYAKYLVTSTLSVGVPVSVLGDIVQLRYVNNPGAAFSLGTGATWIFAIIATVVAVVIISFAHRIRSTAWAVLGGLLLGGNLGNLSDRLFREPGFGIGHVVDFIQIYGFPAIFNAADIAIVSSMGLFIIFASIGLGIDGSRRASGRAKGVGEKPAPEAS